MWNCVYSGEISNNFNELNNVGSSLAQVSLFVFNFLYKKVGIYILPWLKKILEDLMLCAFAALDDERFLRFLFIVYITYL